MPYFRRLPLGQLTLYCPPLRQTLSVEEEGAWRELQRRALGEQNPAAWDALLMRLWPTVLFAIYERTSEIPPATAELLAQRILSAFKRRHRFPVTPATLPSHEWLLVELQQFVEQWLGTYPPSTHPPPIS